MSLLVPRWLVARYAENQQQATSQPATILLVPVCLGAALALWTVSLHTHIPSPATVDFYADGGKVVLIGMIADFPDRRPTVTQYTVHARTIQHMPVANKRTQQHPSLGAAPESNPRMAHEPPTNVNSKVLVRDWGGWPEFQYGDRVQIVGSLERPKPTEGFAYDRYLALSGIHSILKSERTLLLESGRGWKFMSALFALRTWFEGHINRLYPEPHASFLAGLLLGSRRGMSPHVTETLQATGLAHIVAISGYNVTIIVNVMGALLAFLPRRMRLLLTALLIVSFALLIGASPSAVRAAIMGIIGCIALESGRMETPRLVLLWTAFLMLLKNPAVLWDDVGFQLSFLAVIGLIECGPILRPLLGRVPRTLNLQDTLLMTLAAQIFTIPWIAARFGRIALVAPLSNIIAAPLVPLSMLLGFLSSAISVLLFPLGQVLAYLAWACMEMILMSATLLARLPFASIPAPRLSPFLITIVYTGLVAAVLLVQRYRKRDVILPSHAIGTSSIGC